MEGKGTIAYRGRGVTVKKAKEPITEGWVAFLPLTFYFRTFIGDNCSTLSTGRRFLSMVLLL